MTIPSFLRPPQQMSRNDRRIVTLMAIATLAASYSAGLLSYTLPFSRRSLGLTEGQMSFLLAATRAVSLGALVFSVVGDRRGRRTPFLVAFTLLPLANLTTALLPGLAVFATFQSIGRVAAVAATALAVVILAEELTPGVRAYGMAVWGLFGAMGAGLGLILLPIAEWSDDSWRVLFGISAVGLLVVPLLRRHLGESRAFVATERRAPLLAALRRGHGRYLWPMAGVAFFSSVFGAIAFGFGLERLIDDLQWSTATARLLVLIASGAGTAGLLVGGRLADTAGRRPTVVIALMLALTGGVGFYVLESGWLIGPAIFLATFGATATSPALAAHRAELFPTGLRATAGAWITNASLVGSISGFAIGFLLIDAWGLSTTVTVLGVGVIFAAFLELLLPETRGRDLVRRPPPAPDPPNGDDPPGGNGPIATTPASPPVPASASADPTTLPPAPSPGE